MPGVVVLAGGVSLHYLATVTEVHSICLAVTPLAQGGKKHKRKMSTTMQLALVLPQTLLLFDDLI